MALAVLLDFLLRRTLAEIHGPLTPRRPVTEVVPVFQPALHDCPLDQTGDVTLYLGDLRLGRIAIHPQVEIELVRLAVVIDEPGVVLHVPERPLDAYGEFALAEGLQADAQLLDGRPDIANKLPMRIRLDAGAAGVDVWKAIQPQVVGLKDLIEQAEAVLVGIRVVGVGHWDAPRADARPFRPQGDTLPERVEQGNIARQPWRMPLRPEANIHRFAGKRAQRSMVRHSRTGSSRKSMDQRCQFPEAPATR